MPKAPPSFDFYYNDWIGGTRHLPAMARAFYLDLMIHQWQNGFVPNSAEFRQHLWSVPPETEQYVWKLIRDKFEVIDDAGNLANERMQMDREEAIQRWLNATAHSTRISEVRRKAAEKRWNMQTECKTDANAYANAMQTDAKREGGSRKEDPFTDEPSEDPASREDPTPVGSLSARKDPFDSFWENVHIKTNKRGARKAFAKAVDIVAKERSWHKNDAASFIIDRMAAFASTPRANKESPIHPATWLNQGCYEDDPATWQVGDQMQGKAARGRKACQEFINDDFSDYAFGDSNGNSRQGRIQSGANGDDRGIREGSEQDAGRRLLAGHGELPS